MFEKISPLKLKIKFITHVKLYGAVVFSRWYGTIGGTLSVVCTYATFFGGV